MSVGRKLAKPWSRSGCPSNKANTSPTTRPRETSPSSDHNNFFIEMYKYYIKMMYKVCNTHICMDSVEEGLVNAGSGSGSGFGSESILHFAYESNRVFK
eukprot:1344214-Amorphochlora_amoeboformis.AAC.2